MNRAWRPLLALVNLLPCACLSGTSSVGGLPTTSDSTGGGGVIPPDCAKPIPAFPGAEGHGALTPAGRFGQVLHVTSLEDSGSGSLREALETAGPRIVVFDVGGTIELRSTIAITEPYVTVAGQSAPSDGIQIRIAPDVVDAPLVVTTHDVVLRHLRSRPGPSNEPACCRTALTVAGGAHDVVVDHMSLSWATDEVFVSWYDAYDVTVQWSMLAEGLYDSTNVLGPYSRATAMGADIRRHTLHHNLLAHNDNFNPELGSTMQSVMVFANNVVYDRGELGGILHGAIDLNVVGNTFLAGPSTITERRSLVAHDDVRIYVHDNRGPHRPDDATDEWAVVGHEDDATMPADEVRRASEPFDAPALAIDPADVGLERVLAGAGATRPTRDPVDTRIVEGTRAGSGRIIDHPDDVGGWPQLDGGAVPQDVDRDGMPDEWEREHDLDPDDPADGSWIDETTCYTWVERYLNELADG